MKPYFTLKNALSVVIAFIFIQSMFFKFAEAPETVYIFTTLGKWAGLSWFGQYGGYLVGIVELIASILLFTRWHGFGALLFTRSDFWRHCISSFHAIRYRHANLWRLIISWQR